MNARWLTLPTQFIGFAVVVAGALIAGLRAYDAGWLDQALPPRREAVAASIASPVAVKLQGSVEILSGRESFFFADVTSGGKPVWKLLPNVPNALTVSDDGKRARFQSSEEGSYVIVVSVAGPGLDVANDAIEFENLHVQEASDEPPMAQVQASQPQPRVTVADLAQAALDQVSGEHRAAEARELAGSIQAFVKRIETGLVEPGADVGAEFEKVVDAALTDRAKNWHPLIEQVHAIIGTLREQGEITTAATAVGCLREITAALSRLK